MIQEVRSVAVILELEDVEPDVDYKELVTKIIGEVPELEYPDAFASEVEYSEPDMDGHVKYTPKWEFKCGTDSSGHVQYASKSEHKDMSPPPVIDVKLDDPEFDNFATESVKKKQRAVYCSEKKKKGNNCANKTLDKTGKCWRHRNCLSF